MSNVFKKVNQIFKNAKKLLLWLPFASDARISFLLLLEADFLFHQLLFDHIVGIEGTGNKIHVDYI